MSLNSFVHAMPKAELHVHLEGSIQPGTLLELARRNGVSLSAQDEPSLRALYQFHDFGRFVEVYTLIQKCLRTADDWALITRRLGDDLARQNVRYAEVTWTPSMAVRSGLPFAEALRGVEEGRAAVRAEHGIEMRWLPDAARDLGLAEALQTVEWLLSSPGHGILALGLGGSENLYPPEGFVEPFARAKAGGLRSYPHAGELLGPVSIWTALELLQADRIGHGVRAIEDPELVAFLRERRIALDICPTSNVCLHVYPDYAHHPLRRLFDAGLLVTLNSDDPPLFNTDLENEYRLAVSEFGFTAEEICTLSLNAVEASFLESDERSHLRRTFEDELERAKRLHL
ncbi:MAG: adenosine deaminase [Anaerolineae bacterium]